MKFSVPFALILLMVTACAFGWSTKEHVDLTRLAIADLIDREDIPADMKAWLREAAVQVMLPCEVQADFIHKRHGVFPRGVDGIAYWAAMPDLVADSSRPTDLVQPYGVPERSLHFIDLELFNPDADRQKFMVDLSGRPAIDAFPRDMSDPRYRQAGMLPFRVEECQRRLVLALREGRLTDQESVYPRDEHAGKWAGYLAHYLADAAQPHHGTVDYKSASFFPDHASPPNVHAAMEYLLVDDEQNDLIDLRTEVWDEMLRCLESLPIDAQAGDPWARVLNRVWESYATLPLIGEAAASAWEPVEGGGRFDLPMMYHFTGRVDGKKTTVAQMKARQLALAVRDIQGYWLQAWREAHAQ